MKKDENRYTDYKRKKVIITKKWRDSKKQQKIQLPAKEQKEIPYGPIDAVTNRREKTAARTRRYRARKNEQRLLQQNNAAELRYRIANSLKKVIEEIDRILPLTPQRALLYV